MTTTQDRPSLARKHTPKSEAARNAEMDAGVKITHEGRAYVVRVGDISAQVARRFRREVGRSFRAIVEELTTDPDIDSVSAVIWMSRLIDGEDVSLDEVAFDYAALDAADVEVADQGDESDPEA